MILVLKRVLLAIHLARHVTELQIRVVLVVMKHLFMIQRTKCAVRFSTTFLKENVEHVMLLV